ncbi:MAG: DUF948 domain-containing protein [Eubacteriales bacterium]|nr:DUF948 domain-containing protein [Eubacteriales bacterium]
MQSWEYVVIAVGAALVVLMVYLIAAVKKLSAILGRVDKLLADNENGISGIIGNTENITSTANDVVADVKSVSGEIKNAADGVKKTISDISASNAKASEDPSRSPMFNRAIKAAGTAVTIAKVLRNRHRDKQLKQLKKEVKKYKS